MRWIELTHRWLGGTIGLLLAAIGLSGAILVHRDAWTMVPHKHDAVARSADQVAMAVRDALQDGAGRLETVTFAAPGFSVDRLEFAGGRGAYADQTGHVLVRWNSEWARPELWLFDCHRHLFAGDAGETVVGLAGLAGILFIVTGSVLWWRTRRTFSFRLLPMRLSRPAIVRHHRDLGIVMAPLLLLSFVTGTVLVFRPLSSVVLGPGAAAAITQAAQPPRARSASLGQTLDWTVMLRAARMRLPRADFRALIMPRGQSGLITLRMKQPWEWLPNGRTTIWFAADTGRVVAVRDAGRLPAQVRAYNILFPLHAGAVGGLAYRIVMTLPGLALVLLGSLAVWTFWGPRKKAEKINTSTRGGRLASGERFSMAEGVRGATEIQSDRQR